MADVSYDKVNAMTIAAVNLDSQRRFLPGTIDSGMASVDQVKEAILLADSQVVLADVDNPYHYRDLQASADLDHGDSIPGGVMRPCTILVKIAPADAIYIAGVRGAWGTDQIERWRRNHNNIYGPLAHNVANSPLGAKIALKGNKLFFTGSKARIMRAPEFVIQRDPPACQSDEAYTQLVFSGSVFNLYQEGFVSDALFGRHQTVWEKGIEKLQQRAVALLGGTEL